MNKKIINHRDEGFTLIELLVVIAILGLLSTIFLSYLNAARQKGINASIIRSAHELRSALELYASDNRGQYPGEQYTTTNNVRFIVPNGEGGSTDISKNPTAFNLRTSLEEYIGGSVLSSPLKHTQAYFTNTTYRCGNQDNTVSPRYVILLKKVGGFDADLPGFFSSPTSSLSDTHACISGPTN